MARRGVRLALATALSLSAAGPAAAQTISGTLTSSPHKSWHTAVAVEAISVDNGIIAAVVRPSRGRWSMSLGPGHYLVGSLESDSKTGTAILSDQQLIQVPGASRTARTAVAKVIGMGDIPIDAAAGIREGGDASTSITVGMLPQCDAQGDKVVDRTKVGQDAIQQEKQLSDQGKTPFPIAYNPINPTISVEGKIRLSNETAIADLKLVDPGTGQVTKHVVIRGDAADFNSDLSSFLNFVGKSVAKFDCSKPKPQPKPKANGPLRFSIEYAGSYIDQAADPGNFHLFDLNMKWDEVLSGTVTRGASVKAKPMKLTLSGTTTTQNNVNGSSDTATCFLRPGSIPISAGGFINITPGSPPAAGSLVKGFRTFKAWASIPLTQANGEIGYAPGSSSPCARGDLRPFDAQSMALPPQWDKVALADVEGRWRTPLTRTRRASFTLTSGFTDTVQVSANITVTTSGTP